MRICNDGRTWPDTTAAEFRRLVEEHARTDYPCQEWHVAGSWHGVGRCLACGRPVKNGAYVIRHAGTGDTLGPIGPSCVRPFEHGHAASDVADLCDLKRISDALGPGAELPIRRVDGGAFTPGALFLLEQLGALDRRDDLPWDGLDSCARHEVLLSAARRKHPDDETLRTAREIVEQRVRPWLRDWDGAV